MLGGGDDYELLFTADRAAAAALDAIANELDLPITAIGRIKAGSGVVAVDEKGDEIDVPAPGWRHCF